MILSKRLKSLRDDYKNNRVVPSIEALDEAYETAKRLEAEIEKLKESLSIAVEELCKRSGLNDKL